MLGTQSAGGEYDDYEQGALDGEHIQDAAEEAVTPYVSQQDQTLEAQIEFHREQERLAQEAGWQTIASEEEIDDMLLQGIYLLLV